MQCNVKSSSRRRQLASIRYDLDQGDSKSTVLWVERRVSQEITLLQLSSCLAYCLALKMDEVGSFETENRALS
jgi:hypothetical protein